MVGRTSREHLKEERRTSHEHLEEEHIYMLVQLLEESNVRISLIEQFQALELRILHKCLQQLPDKIRNWALVPLTRILHSLQSIGHNPPNSSREINAKSRMPIWFRAD